MASTKRKKSKQNPINQAETNTEAAGQCNDNAADNVSQQLVPKAENMDESTKSEDNMEAFYASIEAETNVVSTSTRPSEETQNKLRILRDLVRKKFTLLLHPARSGQMKDILKYLISLAPDEGVSLGAKSVMQQLLTNFPQWSLDYFSATLQIQSAYADIIKSEKVKVGLEANVKDFREVAMAEKVLCTKLASLEEKKKELEEKINAIKSEIANLTAERDTVAKRKRGVFDNGKLLKVARDDLRNKLPRLKVEQERSKVTQASIEEEWSKLGEQIVGSTSYVENWI